MSAGRCDSAQGTGWSSTPISLHCVRLVGVRASAGEPPCRYGVGFSSGGGAALRWAAAAAAVAAASPGAGPGGPTAAPALVVAAEPELFSRLRTRLFTCPSCGASRGDQAPMQLVSLVREEMRGGGVARRSWLPRTARTMLSAMRSCTVDGSRRSAHICSANCWGETRRSNTFHENSSYTLFRAATHTAQRASGELSGALPQDAKGRAVYGCAAHICPSCFKCRRIGMSHSSPL